MRRGTTEGVAVVGAGVAGLTCGVVFAERGYRTTIFARETGQRTTSAAAAAIWFPYDAEPVQRVVEWSLATFGTLRELARNAPSGVAMVELRNFARSGTIKLPAWAASLGARRLSASEMPPGAVFSSGYSVEVPVADTSIYLGYLAERFTRAGGTFADPVSFSRLEDVSPGFGLVINCSGAGARQLVGDEELEPHRGQVVLTARLDLPYALVCDDPPLVYAIPRTHDWVLGGSNDISDDDAPSPRDTQRILAEVARAFGTAPPTVQAERVGVRPFRRTGIRLERGRLRDGRPVIHNYGHGGSGFTLSWGCAKEVVELGRS